MAFRRFVSHKAAVGSCFVIAILALFVVLAPFTARYGVNQSVQAPPNSFLSPRGNAWLGTDDIGRDLYSRLIYGVRVSLLIGLASALISVTLGALIGAIAGFRGGKFDDIMMRVTDHFFGFPIFGNTARSAKRVGRTALDEANNWRDEFSSIHHCSIRNIWLDGCGSYRSGSSFVAQRA